jgi:hypothetical protein
MSAPKVANGLHWVSDVGISDQSLRNRLSRNVNLPARKLLVLVHVAWQPSIYAGLSINGMYFCLLMSFVFLGILQMDALVFGEDKLNSTLNPEKSFNMTAGILKTTSHLCLVNLCLLQT